MLNEGQPERKIAVITGTTRDVGMHTAMYLGQVGYDIIGLYRNPQHEKDQEAIKNIIQGYRVRMDVIRADLTDLGTPGLVAEMLAGRKPVVVVCNAAGGFGKDLEEAREINVKAQQRLVDGLLDNLSDRGVLVYLNSEAGHRYHRLSDSEKELLGAYEVVAKSKNEAEYTFRSRIPEFLEMGIRYGVVAANALEGTFVSRILRKSHKPLVSAWQDITPEGYFPTATDMAVAVGKVVRGDFPSGHTEYVGIRPEYQVYPARPLGLRLFGAPPMMEGSIMSREEVEAIILQRWPFNFIGAVDEFEPGVRAVGRLVDLNHPDINWRKGHFPGHPLVPGTIAQEALEQLGSMVVLGLPQFRDRVALLRGVEMKFKDQIIPGELIKLIAEGMNIKEARGIVFGDGHVRALNAAGKPAVEGNVSFVILDRSQLKAA